MAVIRISKGLHWRNDIQKAFDSFRDNEMNLEISKQLGVVCQNILIKAVQFRLALSAELGHNYTGNLINSIVVVLYDDGEISSVYAAGRDGQIRKPICRKMTARKKVYHYNNDWSGQSSSYRAEVPTNRGVADEDIANFLNTNSPSISKGFCITVAYTVEYASWVEQERGTTGYLDALAFSGKAVRRSFKQIKQIR